MSSTQQRFIPSIQSHTLRIADALTDAGIAQQINDRSDELPRTPGWYCPPVPSKDREGKVLEDPDGMFRRVARNLSLADLNYGATEAERQATEDEFYDMMRRLECLPNSPTLMNAGRELQQLSACFVLPVDDALDSIFDKVKQTALIHKSGGGTGFSFSRLRPRETLSAPPAAWPADRSASSGPSTPRPTWSSRAAPGAAPTWGFSALTTRTC